jgi:hypothetical protein
VARRGAGWHLDRLGPGAEPVELVALVELDTDEHGKPGSFGAYLVMQDVERLSVPLRGLLGVGVQLAKRDRELERELGAFTFAPR